MTLCLKGKRLFVVSDRTDKMSLYKPMAKMGRPGRTAEAKQMMKDVGIRLRWVRKAWGLTQDQMAQKIGVHQTAWSLYERGARFPDQFDVVRLLAKLKISREYLLEGSLEGVDRDLAIRLAAAHPELVEPTHKAPRKDKAPLSSR